ncbi:MAG: hypothetical protein FWD19_03810, partial [Defluviitaleaceae bacterium]|nr:hypothetical protein [Defluviitaleaceae bacterium]
MKRKTRNLMAYALAFLMAFSSFVISPIAVAGGEQDVISDESFAVLPFVTITTPSALSIDESEIIEIMDISPLNTGTFNLSTGQGTGTGWVWNNPVLTVNNGANITITGTTGERRVAVAENATADITLHNVSINRPEGTPLLLRSNANVNLTLIGENTLEATNSSGIYVPPETTLTVTVASTG